MKMSIWKLWHGQSRNKDRVQVISRSKVDVDNDKYTYKKINLLNAGETVKATEWRYLHASDYIEDYRIGL